MPQSFVHLRLHTEYSLIDGLLTLKPLLHKAASDHMSALAITDFNNLFAAVKFYKTALACGVKPIIGADLAVYNEQNPTQPYWMTCLCQNLRGYRTLMQLISKSYLDGSRHGYAAPAIAPEWFQQAHEGLILFSGERGGDIGEALLKQDNVLTAARLDFWLNLFGDRFYLEIQRNARPNQDHYIEAAYDLARQKGVPLVATNDVRFLNMDDYDAHEARVCIHEGTLLSDKNRRRDYSELQYFKSQQEMLELFSDVPEALANTIEIAKRCTLELNLGEVFFPKFTPPAGLSTDEYCTQLATEGLQNRLACVGANHPTDHDIYQQRLKHELSVIHAMGFSAYFLIVADFIAWARAEGIPVGPGRGSGAGSLVAYVLRITDIDPIPYKLLFERFLNPERISLPDFDIDFCMIGRDRVIGYVAEKYGRDCVAQIITFGTMAAKAVIRDVGRVLAHPYGFVDKLAKLIPFELGITLDKALEQEDALRERYQNEEEVHDLFDLARKLEGITRNAGKHAGGVVIAPSALTDFTALYCETTEADATAVSTSIVTQFDKDDVEAIGLIKFDFLGLRTLTIIDWALKIINQKLDVQQVAPVNISTLPLDDPLTYELIKNGETSAVFQIESRGMKDLIRRLQPDCFEDLIALVALYRPGPLQSGMVEDFIDRKHGRATVLYPHESLEEILQPTYGVILYQEQVMQIAQVLAGYTLGSADLLRRAMGKKKAEEMAEQREVFLRGAASNGIARPIANTIFDLMEKFAGYGFNKSHSAAYALISYQTAWLKAHYPAEYMAAVLSSDMDNTDKVVSFLYECRRMNLTVLPPDINTSEYYFTVPNDAHIRYGLGAIKGIGQAAVQLITETRQRGGRYSNLFEFFKRIDGGKLNRRTMESLIRSGALDSIHACRATLLHNLEFALSKAEQEHKRSQQRQQDLFATLEKNEAFQHWTIPSYVEVAALSELERLQGEKNTLGFYLSGHPLDRYAQEFNALGLAAITDIQPEEQQVVRTRGILVAQRNFLTRNGAKMGVITLEDQLGKIDVTLFSDIYQQVGKKLQKDDIILVEGEASIDAFNQQVRLIARKLLTLEDMLGQHAQCLVLQLTRHELETIVLPRLMELLSSCRGGRTALKIKLRDPEHPEHAVELTPAEMWHIKLNTQLLRELEVVLGPSKTTVIF